MMPPCGVNLMAFESKLVKTWRILSASARACGISDARAIATMADVEAFAPTMQDVSSGPRFASIKIDGANLERVLSSRDGTFIVTRIRGALGFHPI